MRVKIDKLNLYPIQSMYNCKHYENRLKIPSKSSEHEQTDISELNVLKVGFGTRLTKRKASFTAF